MQQQVQINDTFPDEQLLVVSHSNIDPWFADIVNYLASKVIPLELSFQQRKKFLSKVKHYYWEEPINLLQALCIPNSENLCSK